MELHALLCSWIFFLSWVPCQRSLWESLPVHFFLSNRKDLELIWTFSSHLSILFLGRVGAEDLLWTRFKCVDSPNTSCAAIVARNISCFFARACKTFFFDQFCFFSCSCWCCFVETNCGKEKVDFFLQRGSGSKKKKCLIHIPTCLLSRILSCLEYIVSLFCWAGFYLFCRLFFCRTSATWLFDFHQ